MEKLDDTIKQVSGFIKNKESKITIIKWIRDKLGVGLYESLEIYKRAEKQEKRK